MNSALLAANSIGFSYLLQLLKRNCGILLFGNSLFCLICVCSCKIFVMFVMRPLSEHTWFYLPTGKPFRLNSSSRIYFRRRSCSSSCIIWYSFCNSFISFWICNDRSSVLLTICIVLMSNLWMWKTLFLLDFSQLRLLSYLNDCFINYYTDSFYGSCLPIVANELWIWFISLDWESSSFFCTLWDAFN